MNHKSKVVWSLYRIACHLFWKKIQKLVNFHDVLGKYNFGVRIVYILFLIWWIARLTSLITWSIIVWVYCPNVTVKCTFVSNNRVIVAGFFWWSEFVVMHWDKTGIGIKLKAYLFAVTLLFILSMCIVFSYFRNTLIPGYLGCILIELLLRTPHFPCLGGRKINEF